MPEEIYDERQKELEDLRHKWEAPLIEARIPVTPYNDPWWVNVPPVRRIGIRIDSPSQEDMTDLSVVLEKFFQVTEDNERIDRTDWFRLSNVVIKISQYSECTRPNNQQPPPVDLHSGSSE